MPGFDGTGPRGEGPMTGGGRGFCARPDGYGPTGAAGRWYPPYGAPTGYAGYWGRPVYGVGRGGIPYGGGRGRAFGGGRSRGWRW